MRYLRICVQFGAVLMMVACLWLVRFPFGNVVNHIGLTGWVAVIVWVFILALAAILPVPSEPVMTATLKAYGAVGGTVMNLVGAVLGAICLYYVGSLFSATIYRLFERIKTPTFTRVKSRAFQGSRFGALIIIQLLPLPFLIINLVLGALPNVSFGWFLLASIIGFAPYQIGWTALYLGALQIHHLWLLSMGLVGIVVVVWSIRQWLKKVVRKGS